MNRKCPYCHKLRRDKGTGWHNCDPAKIAEKRLASLLETIHLDMEKPGFSIRTNADLKNREDQRHQIANGLKLIGGEVRRDYA